MCPLAAARAAIELTTPPPFNLPITTRAYYRRITSRAIAIESRLGYFRHVQFPFAGYAQQRGPAFSLLGTGQIG
jgi:hypothetical protein